MATDSTNKDQTSKGFVVRRRDQTTDLKEAYKNNTAAVVPGYGRIERFRDFYEELGTSQTIDEFIREAKHAPQLDAYFQKIRDNLIDTSFAEGGMLPPKEENSEYSMDVQNKPEQDPTDTMDVPTQPIGPQKKELAPDPYARAVKRNVTFDEKFSAYFGNVLKDNMRAGINYSLAKEKENELRGRVFPTFKDAYKYYRRRAIDKGILYKDESNFRWTNPETGEEKLYHPRSPKEQEQYMKRIRKDA